MHEPLRTLTLDSYRPFAHCRAVACTSREGFVPVSATLEAGKVYGLLSEFGGGAWALTTCIGGRGEPRTPADGRILRNGRPMTDSELIARACFVGEPPEKHRLKCLCPTVCQHISRALRDSGLPYTAEEIRQLFRLSDGRFSRRIDRVSGEIWAISQAIGFAAGKDVFCWPWMYEPFSCYLRAAKEQGLLDLLRQHGKLVLVPSADEGLLRACCDRVIRMYAPEDGGPALVIE